MTGPNARLRHSLLSSAFALLSLPALAAPQAPSASPQERYQNCLSLANLDPSEALRVSGAWIKAKGGGPAEHCMAMALIELKRYPEAATRLDQLGRAPGMGDLRPTIFDQAGNAWMLAGDASKAAASFSAALALSANDADLYADLARAQAMLKQWSAVESDLNAALALEPRRPDFLVLRASARAAQGKLRDARDDADAALKLKPNSPEALVQRGEIARRAGDLANARRDFQAALKNGGTGEAAVAAREGLALTEENGGKP